MKKWVIEKNGKYEVVMSSGAAIIPNALGHLIGDYERGDEKFIRQEGDNYIVCPEMKSQWIKDQLNNE